MTNSRRTSRGPVQLMSGPGTGPRSGGWETLCWAKLDRQTLWASGVWACQNF